jgi:deoxyribodipyrimidine photo-lyase
MVGPRKQGAGPEPEHLLLRYSGFMRALVWLRLDLRVRDNWALFEAARRAERGVIALYVIDGSRSKIQQEFILCRLEGLKRELEARNIALLVRKGKPKEVVPAVMRQHRCDTLFVNEVIGESHSVGVETELFPELLCEDILTKGGDPYKVFTPFAKAWRAAFEPGVFGLPRKQEAMVCQSSRVPKGKALELWPAGEGEKRLRHFLGHKLKDYHKLRDFPALEGTSRLSPYLAIGAISARQCLEGVPLGHVWATELIWREFYRYILHHFPRLKRGEPFTQDVTWRRSRSDFKRWCEGRTGVPIVDAAMMQLRQEGWMHNRLRMIVAMFLTKDLLIDWRWGERFFMEHLIDGDWPSNNGGWQWSASTGTDAAPYFRIYNPEAQAKRFDPDGDFVAKYLPEPRADQPIVDHAEARERALKAFKR